MIKSMIKKKSFIDVFINKEGFSLIEIMMVMSIIAILLQIGFTAWLDYKRKAHDSAAITDARNLLEAIVNDMVESDEVKYDHEWDDGRRIGIVDYGGNSRPPSFFLSPGVRADITGGVNPIGTDNIYQLTSVEAILWHPGGTPWGAPNPDGTREYHANVYEDSEVIVVY